MAASITALAEPTVLRWARESIGLSELAAARRIGVPEDRVGKWESGEEQPTIAQLKKAASVYNRSLAVFFLPSPPTDFDTLLDFRRLDGSDARAWSPELHVEFRRAHRQRENTLGLLDLEDESPDTEWRLAAHGDDEAIAAAARRSLLTLTPLDFEGASTPTGT